MRVVCLIASFWRGRSGSLVIQQIIASMSWLGFGAFLTRAIMSPRLTSTSSSSRTVTDIGGNASSISLSNRSMPCDRRGHAAGQHDDLVARLQHAAGDLAGVPAVVVVLVGLRAYDVLHREAGVDQVAVGGDVDVLEVVHERRAVVPRRVLGAGHDVVALERRDRDDREVGDRQLGGEGRELLVDPVVDLLATSRRGPSC